MYSVPVNGSHAWEKKNLITISSRHGGYDEMICKNCGIRGRRYRLDIVYVSESYSLSKAFNCPIANEVVIPKRVKVTLCLAVGSQFRNLTPNSEHDVIEPPKGYKNDHTGVWVMGNVEPVKLLSNEFKILS